MLQPTQLSDNGPTFSRIVFGVMKWGDWGHRLNPQEMLRLIEQSIEYGVTTFDHADIYGAYTTEAQFGQALKLQPALREQIQLITKCGIKLIADNRPRHKAKSYDTSRAHILFSVENSLANLHTDYIDLLLLHRPSPLMDPHEVAEAFGQLHRQGKVKYFGVSNFTNSQYELLSQHFALVTNQVEASLLHLNPFLDGTFDLCLRKGVLPMAWAPLGGGKIFADKESLQAQRVREVAEAIVNHRDKAYGLDQVMLAWLMKHPANILPVVGTARIERLKAAADAIELELTREEWFELWEASTGEEVP